MDYYFEKVLYHLVSGESSLDQVTWLRVKITGLHFLKLDGELFCILPSLARLYSAAASPSSGLRLDGLMAIIHYNDE